MYSCILLVLFLSSIHNYSTKTAITPIVSHEEQFYNQFFGYNCKDMKIQNSSYDACDVYSLLMNANPENDHNFNKFEMLVLSMIIFHGLNNGNMAAIQTLNTQLDSNRTLSLEFVDSLQLKISFDDFSNLLVDEKFRNELNKNVSFIHSNSQELDARTLVTTVSPFFRQFGEKGSESIQSVRDVHVENQLNTNINHHGIAASFVSWFIITVLGLLGFVLIPLKKYAKVYIFTLQLLTALGFGTLSGDAIYHLLPHSLFDHTHDHAHHEHSHENTSHEHHSHENSHNHKTLEFSVFLFGIIFFYIIEVLIKWCPYTKNLECGCHSHNHNPDSDLREHKHETNPVSDCKEIDNHCHEEEHHHHHCVNIEAAHDIKHTTAQHIFGVGFSSDLTTTLKKSQLTRCHGDIKTEETVDQEVSIIEKTPNNCSITKNALTTVLVILLADMAHHFFDGLSLAASFTQEGSNGYNDGISTALAIMLHEFPHKIGDIALLIKSGYSEKKATIIVVGTSLISLIGVIVGCAISNTYPISSKYINLFTAGMFLYIALVLMMSQMITAVGKPELPVPVVILSHIIGISLGLGIMILISHFE